MTDAEQKLEPIAINVMVTRNATLAEDPERLKEPLLVIVKRGDYAAPEVRDDVEVTLEGGGCSCSCTSGAGSGSGGCCACSSGGGAGH
jgi:hypothetical protein